MKKHTWKIIVLTGLLAITGGTAFAEYVSNQDTSSSSEEVVSKQSSESSVSKKKVSDPTGESEAKASKTKESSDNKETEVTAVSEAPAVTEASTIADVQTPAAAEPVIEEAAVSEQPAEAQQAAAPVEEVQTNTAAAPVNSAPTYQPMTIYIAGQAVPYQNGGTGSGQSIIDSNPNGTASTWGGAATQSGSDGMNTHFIGHNPGIFSVVFNVGVGSVITVTDGAGTPTNYVVQTLLQVNDYGEEVGTGRDVWDLTVGTGGGERITLQSCVNDSINTFVLAYKQ